MRVMELLHVAPASVVTEHFGAMVSFEHESL